MLAIGLAQITGQADEPDANRDLSLQAARELFGRGADIVVLPELIVPGYATDRESMLVAAEPLNGRTVRAWQSAASDAGGLLVGGFCEREGDAIFNSAVIVGAEGVVLHYRKLHLFADEKRCFTPGDLGLPVANTRHGMIGTCVCYDLRFVETARALSLQGAQLICVPTAWLPGFDRERWDEQGYCPQARSVVVQSNLDQVYIACASQAGPSGPYHFLGSSLLSDPYGQVVLGPLPGSRRRLALAEVDLGAVGRAHDRGELINPRQDRRTDTYALSLSGRLL